MKKTILILLAIFAFAIGSVKAEELFVTEEGYFYFYYPEVMPIFPYDLNTWLSENIIYPWRAWIWGVQERIVVEFVIEKDGSVGDVEVISGRNRHLRAEAIRLVNSMPKWTPGEHRGQIVSVRFALPIHFRF